MRCRLFGAFVVLSFVTACGSLPSPSGTGPNDPPDAGGAGGSGATLGQTPNETTGQLGFDTATRNEPALGEELSGDICAGWTQAPVSVESVIAGANATGSATAAREALWTEAGADSPVPTQIRTQDFINYYAPQFSEPAGAPASVQIQLRPAALPGQYDLLVAIRAARLAARPRAVITLAVDNTQSMGSEGLAKAKLALRAIAGKLQDGDVVHLLTAAADAVVERFEIASESVALMNAIDGLSLAAERPTVDLLDAAYVAAQERHDGAGLNRVLVVSDGAGDPASLPLVIEAFAAPGPRGDIRMVALGTGPARQNDHRLLRAASRLGRGSYHYMDTALEAESVGARFDELITIALDDVKLELGLPWYFSVQRPYVGDSVAAVTSEPQYVASGGSMTFLFRLAACSPDIAQTAGGTIDARFTWLSPADRAASETNGSAELAELLAGPTPELDKAFAVASYADALRSLNHQRLVAALNLVSSAGSDDDLTEIAELIQRHPAFIQP